MIPTFDFFNIVRQAAKAVMNTATSPIAITLYIAVGFGVAGSTLFMFASNYVFSLVLSGGGFSSLFDTSNYPMLSLALYATGADFVYTIVLSAFRFILAFIGFVPGFLLSLFALNKVRYFRSAMRETWRQMISG